MKKAAFLLAGLLCGAQAWAGPAPARGPVLMLAYTGDGRLLYASPDGLRACAGDGSGCAELADGPLTAAAYSEAAGLLAAGGPDGSVTLISTAGWVPAAWLARSGGPALSLAFSVDGSLLAASGADGRLSVWRGPDWEEPLEFRAYQGAFLLAGALRDGSLATASAGEPLLRLWDPASGELKGWLRSPHTLSAFSGRGGRLLAAASAERTVRIWAPGTGGEPAELALPGPAAAAAAFSPAGGLLAAGAPDGTAYVWRAGGREPFAVAGACQARPAALAFSPSSLYLACGDFYGRVRVKAWSPEVWTSLAGVPVSGADGAVLTTLPAGLGLKAGQAPAGAAWRPVSDGSGLAGWAPAAGLAAEKPDLSPPVIRISSFSLSTAGLELAGSVSYDGFAGALRLGGRPLPLRQSSPWAGPGEPAAFRASGPAPGGGLVLEAEDGAGRRTELPLNPGGGENYEPGYVLVAPPPGTPVLAAPRAGAKTLARTAPGAVLAALGSRGDWRRLEGGGWLKAGGDRLVAERQAPAPPAPEKSPPPRGRPNPRGLAVVIGERDYADADIPRAEYALDDAAAVSERLVNDLGFAPGRVLRLENPTKGELETFFGGEGADGRLKALVRPGETELFVYYSGHGAADPASGTAYLVPSDARPEYLRAGGFPLARLYAALRAAGAARTTVALEACFSGLSSSGPLFAKASPLVLVRGTPAAAGLNVFTSSSGSQISSWYPEKRSGLFTYYFLKALRENCCGKTPLTLGTLRDITAAEVPAAAMRLYGRTQTPEFSGNPDEVLSK